MSENVLIAPTTAAVTAKTGFNTSSYASVVVIADALAGAEEADLYVKAGSAWIVLTDLTGAVVKLTATVPMVALEPGPNYSVTKDLTAGACGVYLHTSRRIRS